MTMDEWNEIVKELQRDVDRAWSRYDNDGESWSCFRNQLFDDFEEHVVIHIPPWPRDFWSHSGEFRLMFSGPCDPVSFTWRDFEEFEKEISNHIGGKKQ